MGDDLNGGIDQIRSQTPEGWEWRVQVCEALGSHQVSVSLVRQGWPRARKRYWDYDLVTTTWTVEDFNLAILQSAKRILRKRQEELNAPDWAKLAREIQNLLNGKAQ